MSDFIDLMFAPFLACLILSGMHAYLGLHVVARGVIFVDLALAQVAACGATFGLLLGYGLHSTEGYLAALSATLIGAIVLTLTRLKTPVVPQEALIGIVYVIAAALAVLILSRTPEGGEELKALLVGHLLFVHPAELTKLTLIYAIIGAIHYAARRYFILVSYNPEGAARHGVNVRLWDLLFYSTFGVVVTSSTELAGVLLVFSFLVVPAVCGALLAESVTGKLIVGWIVGALTSLVGLVASYRFDLPTGATVVCTFGGALAICALLRLTKR
jgi:zinc/manganese transport system permease protein